MNTSHGKYFPDLEKCFSGEASLLLWEDILQYLLSTHTTPSSSIKSFLTDPDIAKIITQDIPTYFPPSNESKTLFNTKTASINVTPSKRNPVNIDQIKNDALWLSENANIEEIEALRITVIEWQKRSKYRLQQGYSEAELSSLHLALGAEYIEKFDLILGGLNHRIETYFDSETSRRSRLISLCSQEQANLISVKREILALQIMKDVDIGLSETETILGSTWKSISSSTEKVLESSINQIQNQLQNLSNSQSDNHDSFQINWNFEIITSSLEKIASIHEILLLQIRSSNTIINGKLLLSWFRLITTADYFTTFQTDQIDQQNVIDRIQSISSLITVSLLDPVSTLSMIDSNFEHLDKSKSKPYILDFDYIGEIHDLIFSAAATQANVHAGPTILSWTLILNSIRQHATMIKDDQESQHVQWAIEGTTNQTSSIENRSFINHSLSQPIFEDILDKIVSVYSFDELIEWMLNYVIEKSQVFDFLNQFCDSQTRPKNPVINTYVLQIIQELLAISISSLGYSPSLLSTQLSILSCQLMNRYNKSIYDPTLIFLQDDYLTKEFFDVAAARFPYECLPFLRLCRTLSKAKIFDENGIQYIHYRLENLNSFTQAAIGEFSSYNTIREDENINYVRLEKSIELLKSSINNFDTRQKKIKTILPINTIGEVISNSYPPIIRWQYSYSGLGLLGQWLELYYMRSLETLISSVEPTEEILSEIISIITVLLSTYLSNTNDNTDQHCTDLLTEMSSQLQSDKDITFYIFELFEQQLQAFRRRTNIESTSYLLNSCLEFITIFIKIHPEQVWSLLIKSSLFNTNGDNNLLLSILNASEVSMKQRFEIVLNCTKLYQALIHIVLSSIFPNNSKHSSILPVALTTDSAKNSKLSSVIPMTLTSNFRHNSNQSGVPTMTLKQTQSLIFSFSEIMINMFNAIEDFHFDQKQQQCCINQMITESFISILQYAFGVGESYGMPTKLTNIYLPAAERISNSFISGISETNSIFRKILSLLENGFDQEKRTRFFNTLMKFLNLLLRHEQSLNPISKTSSFQVRLIAAFPLLIRVLSHNGSTETLRLMITILQSIETKSSSILGSLGQTSTISFLNNLKHLEKHSENERSQDLTWFLLSLLIKDQQQWLGTVILTGRTPQTGSNGLDNNETVIRGESFMHDAIQELSNISNIRPTIAMNIIQFSIQAQQSWFGSITDNKIDQDLFKILISYVCSDNERTELSRAIHNKIVGLITQLITIYLQEPSTNKGTTIMETFIPFLNWLNSNAIQVSNYNTSLHTNLKKNFMKKFDGLIPTHIRKTGLEESEYGNQYFYDIEYANKVFSNEPFWNNQKFDEQSFSTEFRKANLNLSVVDSEVFLLQNFKHLCLENYVFFSQVREVQKIMTKIMSNCLIANTRIYPSEEIFQDIFQIRADLCLVLLRQFVEIQAKGSEFLNLLNLAWEAMKFRNGSYELAIANNDLEYWRSMLSILLMTMQFHVRKKIKPISNNQNPSILQIDSTNSIILEICSNIIGNGFRSIVVTLHDQHQSKSIENLIEPKDVWMVLYILQTILRLPTISQFSGQLSDCLINSDIVSSCLLIYSWACLSSDSNPKVHIIYAELSLGLLNSMSTVPQLAEEFAIQGVLNRILTSRITQSIQNIPGGVSHIDTKANGSFLYNLWANEFLPLCLNLLHAVGGAVAAEVSIFLNQFPQQLNRANLAFVRNSSRHGETTNVLNLKVATEAFTLALISYILNSFRNAGASAAIDPSKILKLDIYDECKKVLEEDIRDIIQENPIHRRKRTLADGEKELSWQRSKDNVLDQKIIQQLRQAVLCLHEENEDANS